MTARERKQAAQKAEKSSAMRRSGKVHVYSTQGRQTPEKVKRNRSNAHAINMGKPKGLSPEAAWDKLRDDSGLRMTINALDWLRLFPGADTDQDEWPGYVAIIKDALAEGELGVLLNPEYQGDDDNGA